MPNYWMYGLPLYNYQQSKQDQSNIGFGVSLKEALISHFCFPQDLIIIIIIIVPPGSRSAAVHILYAMNNIFHLRVSTLQCKSSATSPKPAIGESHRAGEAAKNDSEWRGRTRLQVESHSFGFFFKLAMELPMIQTPEPDRIHPMQIRSII
ncbi:hypothetical protein RYX36_008443 [Vicia faba]